MLIPKPIFGQECGTCWLAMPYSCLHTRKRVKPHLEPHGLSGERTVSPKEKWCRTSKRIRKEVQEKGKNSRYPWYSQIQFLEISYWARKRQREKETERHRKHPVNSCGRWCEAFSWLWWLACTTAFVRLCIVHCPWLSLSHNHEHPVGRGVFLSSLDTSHGNRS